MAKRTRVLSNSCLLITVSTYKYDYVRKCMGKQKKIKKVFARLTDVVVMGQIC